jgi:hypothetical protein
MKNNCRMKNKQKKANLPMKQIKTALAMVLLATFAGCAGYVDGGGGYGGGGYGGTVVVAGPRFYGGGYDRGGDVHGYSHRGSESRAVAHPSGGRGGGGRGERG